MSLVVQWLRTCLPMQGTPVWSLLWEDAACLGAPEPMCHSYWARAVEPVPHNRRGVPAEQKWRKPRCCNKDLAQPALSQIHVPTAQCAQSCPPLCDPVDGGSPGFSVHGDSPGKNTGVGCHFLLQGIFLTQGSNPGLFCILIGRHILYHCAPREGSSILNRNAQA